MYDVTVTGSHDEAVAEMPSLWLIREGFPLLLTLTFTGWQDGIDRQVWRKQNYTTPVNT